ncbi:hypothetical protein CANFE03_11630 [Ligilactobacillus animalis]
MIGILVAKYGWIASNTVLYVAAGLAVLLLVYIMIHDKNSKRAKHNETI